jgi:uncharacterized small protein (DUF1192 family)
MHAQREAVFAQQEVERLRAEVARLTAERDLRAEVARLTAERDDAREMYCREAARHSVCRRSIMDARTIARINGWDCFKEEPCS